PRRLRTPRPRAADGVRAARLPAARTLGLGDPRAVAVQPPRARLEHPAAVHRPPLHPLPPPLPGRTLMPRTRAADALARILDAIPSASGAVVMGTGIVSIALSLDGQETLSRLFLALAATVWVVLAVLLPARAACDHTRFRADLRTPAAFT